MAKPLPGGGEIEFPRTMGCDPFGLRDAGHDMRVRRFARFIVVAGFVIAIGAGIFAVLAWQPAIAPIDPPPANSFDPGLVTRGAELAALGDCDVCHTAPGGREFAGGLGIPTPFGTIYSTNITPDADTGIGQWSEAAFQRALRHGVARDGAYLYPAFPYDHFTLVSDDDDKALYAFLMTRQPIHAAAPANALPFPLNQRLLMYGWNLLFLHPGPYRADATHDDSWNRGAYLAEGLGHCGACHTPRNFFGAEQGTKFAGGQVEGWTAYALDKASPAPLPWNVDALAHYLSHGFDNLHGVARGPMAQVTTNLRAASDEDVQAIATYTATQINATLPAPNVVQQAQIQNQRGTQVAAASAGSQTSTVRNDDEKGGEGAMIYAATCSGCHRGPRAMPFGGIDLALTSGIGAPSAANLINVVLNGLPASEASRAPIMPGFGSAMNDSQVAALAQYLRTHFTDKGPWTDVEDALHKARDAARARISPTSSDQPAPPGASQRSTHEAERQ
jgi:mono/diheme cytochrome c family protein